MTKVMITGATGFLGQALVQAARTAGQDVVALSRGAGPPIWADDASITHVQIDLGHEDAASALAAPLAGVTAVIHAAASFAGDAQSHVRDTIGGTDKLLAALATNGAPRLVLVSSLSVYDVAAMDDGDTLNETAPLVNKAEQRDLYAAAKAAQERSVLGYAGAQQTIRPGAIYGPHRLWSAQLGFAKAGRVFCPGGDVEMPAIEVNRAAAAIVRAASSDGTDPVNLIDPNPPTRVDWLSALGLRTVSVPRGLVMTVAAMTGRRAPWQARFRPLHYDTSRAEEILDTATQRPFKDLITQAKLAEGTSP